VYSIPLWDRSVQTFQHESNNNEIHPNPENILLTFAGGQWTCLICERYEDVSKSFRNGRLERELQMVQTSATRCSCIAILWVSLMRFVAITLYVASQRVFIVVSLYFVVDSVRKLLDTPSYDVKFLHGSHSFISIIRLHRFRCVPCKKLSVKGKVASVLT
jgi:hypothetical protein